MKKFLLGIVLFFLTTSMFAQITWMGNEYTPIGGTQYLGDQILFEIQSWPMADNQGAQVYIDWNNDGYGGTNNVDYFALNWIGQIGNNSKWNKYVTMQQIGTHNRKYLGWQTGFADYITGNMGTFTISPLNNPSDQTAIKNTLSPSSGIDLSWSNDAQNHNVMIVRKKSIESWTEPTQGTAYNVGSSIGSGVVVYNANETSYTNTDLTSSTAYDYKFYSENNSYYSAGVTASATTASATSDYFRSKANGSWSENGTWESSNDNTNWVSATLSPTNSANATIIQNSVAVTGYETVNNLTISTGKILTINSGKSLTVTGTLTNDAGASGLVIKSDATGTGSLIATGSVAATVERYITKYNSTYDKRFHFISSPVSSQAIFTDLSDFYRFSEINNYWISRTGNGVPEAFGDVNFVVGRGYMVANIDNITETFSGTLNNYTSGTPLTITCSKTANKGEGWNLIGNPFPSAIDWDLVKARNSGVDAALYYYDAIEENYRYYIQLGSIGNLGSGSRYIPAMQGFMVHANTNGGTVTINNDDRVHQALTTFYKEGNALSNLLTLKVEANGYQDETSLFFYNQATPEFDGAFDAYKIFAANENVPQIYSLTPNDTRLAINSLPENVSGTTIKMGLKTGSETACTLSVSGIGSFAPGTTIFLVDNKLGINHSLSENPVYTFTSAAGDDPNRFELKFGTVGINETPATLATKAWYDDGRLYFTADEGTTNVGIFNIHGQNLYNCQLHGGGLQSLAINVPSGIYFARILNQGNLKTAKIIVR